MSSTGSCSGAGLFTTYCSTIEDVISYEDGLWLNGFVDDHLNWTDLEQNSKPS